MPNQQTGIYPVVEAELVYLRPSSRMDRGDMHRQAGEQLTINQSSRCIGQINNKAPQ